MSIRDSWGGLCLALLMGASALPNVASGAEFRVDGYYRSRFRAYDNLFLQRDFEGDGITDSPTSDGTSVYFDHRLRFEPEIRVNPYLSVYFQADIFDNRVWGADPTLESYQDAYLSSAGTAQTLGLPASYDMAFAVKRGWAEVFTPIGRLKMGRVGFSTGAGMYFNDGNGWDADTGDTVDRVQFLTRLGPVYALIGYDQIFEGQPGFSNDARALSLAAAYRSEITSASLYAYLQQDHTYPYLPGADPASTEGGGSIFDDELPRNNMNIGTFDLWSKSQFGPLGVEIEGVLRYGTGDMVLLDEGADAPDEYQTLNDVTLLQGGVVAKANYQRSIETYGFEFGMATGDADLGSDVQDNRDTTFYFDPNYRVSLLMFRVPMPQGAATSTQSGLTAGGNTLVTGYSVSNALYIRPNISANVYQGLTVEAAVLLGWAFKANELTGQEKSYGTEFNLGVRWNLWERLDLRARGALLLPGAIFQSYADEDLGTRFNEPALAGEVQAFITF